VVVDKFEDGELCPETGKQKAEKDTSQAEVVSSRENEPTQEGCAF
jgi:hypothetical protein